MKDKFIIFSTATIIIFILGFIAHIQYFQTKDNMIQLYSKKQETLALQAGISLRSYFKERFDALEFLAHIPSHLDFDQNAYQDEIKHTYEVISGFQHIFYVTPEMVSIFGYPEGYPCPANQSADIKRRFKHIFDEAAENRKTLIFERNVLSKGRVTACLVSPIYSEEDQFIGAIIGSIDVKEALHEALQPITVDSEDHVWVINEAGYLIYHSEHEKMLIQNLNNAEPRCFNCHGDFSLEKEMMDSDSGVEIKINVELPKQLIGYANIQLENTKWTVAISTPFAEITQSLRSEFRNFLLLIIAIIVTIVCGAFLFNRINKKHLMIKKELESLKIQTALIEEKNEAESRYRILVEQSPDPIFLCTRKKFIMINQSFEKLFDFNKGELCKENFTIRKIIQPSEVNKFENNIKSFVRNRKKMMTLSLGMKSKSGKLLDVEISLSRFRLGNIMVYQGVIHDVTLTRQLEREKERRKHLAMIGEMSARIAHEIKNPLASIQTGIQLLETKMKENDHLKSYYQRLRKEIQRVDEILKGLLSYAREDHLNIKRSDISALIQRFEHLFEPTINKHELNLKIDVEKKLNKVMIDEQKIEQVLWNVCLNAIQASEKNDTIKIHVQNKNNGVQLQIKDNGSGIPEEIKRKIFHPFFSTRTHGNGLGLAITQKIIEQHQGHIEINSEDNNGTTVTIYLPKEQNKQ